MGLLTSIKWGKLLLDSLPLLAVLVLVWGVYSLGSSSGAAEVQAKWDKQKLADAEQINTLKHQIAEQELAHRQESQRISHDLAEAKVSYTNTVAGLDAEYALRLQASEQRANYYKALSSAGPVESGNLASHAAQLDRSLEEGRRLVKEFRATIELRDNQLKSLGQQILNDRALIGGEDGQNTAPAE